jgi:hypothetical protein
MIGVVLALVGSPAGAQMGSPWWTPKSPEPLESDGEVVLTLSFSRPGRVVYRTFDGTCPPPQPPVAYCGNPNRPCDPQARAPEDYTAVSGEVIFTETGTGRNTGTIRIPIVDDDLAEGDEFFTVEAVEQPNTEPIAGACAIVRITDDDETVDTGGKPATAATTTAAGGRSSGSAPVLTVPPTPSPIGDRPVPDLAVELASPLLQAGPGFELTSDGPPAPAPGRGSENGGGGSAAWLAPALVAAAVSVGALALVRRRRRWSPTQP